MIPGERSGPQAGRGLIHRTGNGPQGREVVLRAGKWFSGHGGSTGPYRGGGDSHGVSPKALSTAKKSTEM